MTENEISFQRKKYISSSRASEISGYTKDYLGQLCRAGEIKCQRVGRGWFVSVDELLLHIKKSPRRNHKKLNKEIVQISSKWAHFLSRVYSLSRFKFNFAKYKKFVFPALGLIFIVMATAGLSFHPDYIAKIEREIYAIYENPTKITDITTQGINTAGDSLVSFSIAASNKTIVLSKEILEIKPEDISQSLFYASGFIDSFLKDIKDSFVMFPQNLKEIVRDFLDLYKEKTIVVKEKGFVEPKARDGLVVIPDVKDEDRIKTIKDSFSDEIIVKPDDEVGDSGIIQPVFRKGKGDEYIYIMVPAKEQNLPAQAGVEDKK